jgi:hypothetical protein
MAIRIARRLLVAELLTGTETNRVAAYTGVAKLADQEQAGDVDRDDDMGAEHLDDERPVRLDERCVTGHDSFRSVGSARVS